MGGLAGQLGEVTAGCGFTPQVWLFDPSSFRGPAPEFSVLLWKPRFGIACALHGSCSLSSSSSLRFCSLTSPRTDRPATHDASAHLLGPVGLPSEVLERGSIQQQQQQQQQKRQQRRRRKRPSSNTAEGGQAPDEEGFGWPSSADVYGGKHHITHPALMQRRSTSWCLANRALLWVLLCVHLFLLRVHGHSKGMP